jgi:DNA-binding NarL/FixJ family response regulator
LGVAGCGVKAYSCFVENDRDLTGTLRVLAVNHNSIFREGLRIFIEAQPNVTLAGSVVEADTAVHLFAETRPDLTLVDLDLPFGRGIEAIRRIREIDPDAWIIGLVTYEWDDRCREAMAAGALAVLSKDLIAEKLMALIRTGPKLCQSAGKAVKSRSRWRTLVRAFLLHGDSEV